MRPPQPAAPTTRRAVVALILVAFVSALLPAFVTPGTASAVVPDPTPETSVINVNVGGDRTGVNGITPLGGVVLGLFDGPTQLLECSSLADGDCNFIVTGTGRGGGNRGRQFTIRQNSAPAGWYSNSPLRTGNADGSGSQATPYVFTTPKLYGGQTYRSGFEFMTGTGNSNRIASGGTWQQSRNNPVLPSTCGLDVALIVDLSGSVIPQLAALKQAAGTFVDSLVGTPSRMSLFSFADSSPAAGGDNFPSLTSVSTQAQADAFKLRWNLWTGGGGTNWDRGIAVAGAAVDEFDVAVMITDGNPSREGDPFSGPGSYTRFKEVEAGIFSANLVKAQGSRMLAVGVGSGATDVDTRRNLAAISGPVLYDGSNLTEADYFQSDNYTAAGSALRALALGNCVGSISVTKEIIPFGGDIDDAEPAGGGWVFNGTGSTDVTFDNSPQTTTDDGTGTVNLPLTFTGETSGPVTVREIQQPGYTLATQSGVNAVCFRRPANTTTPIPVTVTNDNTIPGQPGFAFTAVSADPITCTVYNQAPAGPASIQVDKQWVINSVEYDNGEQPDGFQAELQITGPGGAPATAQTWGSEREGYAVGNTATISEEVTLPPGGLCTLDSDTIDGASNSPPPAGTDLPYSATLAAGDNTYVVTNVVTCGAELTLVKEVLNGPAAATEWNLDADAPPGTPEPGPAGITGTPQTTDVPVTPLVPYALSESGGNQNYEQQDVDTDPTTRPWLCIEINELRDEQPGFIDGLGGVVRVSLGSRVRCTAYNQTAELRVRKDVVNDNGGTRGPGDWRLTATPPETPPGPQTVQGSAQFQTLYVRPGVTYRLTEEGPDGYTLEVGCEVLPEPPQTDSTITLLALEIGDCTFTNRDDPTLLTLVKRVDNRGGGTRGEADWILSADGPRSFSGTTRTPSVTRVEVPSGRYRLSESGPLDYTASGWNCQNGTDAPFTVRDEVDVPPGADLRCEVTNTYVAPTQVARLTLVNLVDNTGGGTAQPTDWTLTADGPEDLSGRSGSPEVTRAEVPPGRYRLAESGGPADYTASAWSCQNRTDTPQTIGTEIDLAAGSEVTCVITNYFVGVGPVPPIPPNPPPPPIPPLPPTGGPGLLPLVAGILLVLAAGVTLLISRRRSGPRTR